MINCSIALQIYKSDHDNKIVLVVKLRMENFSEQKLKKLFTKYINEKRSLLY
jgi:hypothetical protein